MFAFRILGVIALAVAVSAAPTPDSTHVLHEKRNFTETRWTKRERIHPDTTLPMRIGLVQSNLDRADDWLMDVSDPSSPKYAKHWTSEEVIAAFAPSESTVKAVEEWLISSGFDRNRLVHTENKAWFAFDASTSEAEELLHTDFHAYEDTVEGGQVIGCEEYHVPSHIQKHVDYITPGIRLFGQTKRSLTKRSWPAHNGNGDPWTGGSGAFSGPHFKHPPRPESELGSLSTCDVTITPECIRALYHVPMPLYKEADPSNSMGIFEEGDTYEQRNLNMFFSNFTPYIPQGTHPTLDAIDGATAPTTNDTIDTGESDLDFMLTYPLIYPQTITLYQTDDSYYALLANQTYTQGFNTFLDALDGSYCTYSAYGETGDDPTLDPVYPDPRPGGYKGKLQCGVYKPTNVISISYGGQESYVPAAYQKRQCNEYLKLGLQGVSILFASGDAGVSDYPQPYGFGSKTGCIGPDDNVFSPTWPNNCPYVTNVGATKVYPNRTVFEPEIAVYDPAGMPYNVNYSSGGGFSNLYPVPRYQQIAVAAYFAKHNPPYPYYEGGQNLGKNGGLYNRLGRGIPDVAANGDNIAVYNQGVFGLSGGTSASTPIFSSIINRINESRLRLSKRPLGFLNPALYAHPYVLNDITLGHNVGCGTDGFEAVEGWDPVTGLGTPDFVRMEALFLALP